MGLPERITRIKAMNLASIQPDSQIRLLADALSIAWKAIEIHGRQGCYDPSCCKAKCLARAMEQIIEMDKNRIKQ